MIRAAVREWDDLPVGEAGEAGAVSRAVADSLLETARACAIGGADGERVLIDGRRRLRAQQVVGVVASPMASLEILPKIDTLSDEGVRRKMIHMLATVYDLPIGEGALTDLGWQPHDLLEILIRLFIDQVFTAMRGGLPRRYVGRADDLPAVRGRLDAQRQFTVLAASPQRLACRFDELSLDIPLNRLVAAAVRRLRTVSRSPENQRRLAELAFAYADVGALTSPPPPDRDLLDRTNTVWKGVLALARLLLGGRYQTTSAGAQQGFALLFEMNTLFEEYIGRMLRRALTGLDYEVRLQGPGDHALIDQDDKLRFGTRPDIVVLRDGKAVLVIDTKWKRLTGAIDDPKRGVGQADVYQMMAYAQVYRCDRLMLLYPHHGGIGEAAGVLNTHRIRGTENACLSVATVSLGRLNEVCDRLRQLTEGALGALAA